MKPYQHQQIVFERFKDKQLGALFLDQGTGKTKIIIDILEHKYLTKQITAAVIITTSGLVGNWSEEELPKHSSIEYDVYVWKYTKELPSSNKLLYLIVNIDGIASVRFPILFKEFLKKYPVHALVVDESTIVKNRKALRTGAATMMARKAVARFIMSGTPVVQSPLDLYSQTEILSPGLLGFKSFFAFRARYATQEAQYFGPRSFQKIVGYKNLEELTTQISVFAAIIKKEDCLDLPPKMYRSIFVELTDEQQKAYDELKLRAMTYLQDNIITVGSAVALINKLLQICCGQLKVGDAYLSLPNNKLNIINELVDEATGQTIIWTSFVNTAVDLKKALGDKAIHLPAGLSIEARQGILDNFRAGGVRVLIANPASAGHGITLTNCSNVVYYSNSWNLEHRLQSEDRVHRIGQTMSVLYTDLTARNTIEEYVVYTLKKKKLLANSVITNKVMVDLLNNKLASSG
jgi:SNF2 family DNA or RNA helicase